MKYRKNSPIVEAVTFNEFVEYGRAHGGNIVNGMPWHFKYEGHPVTHETDELYLIPYSFGVYKFTPEDMLFIDEYGPIRVMKIDVFKEQYEECV